MFYFPGCTHYIICRQRHVVVRFPHSEIYGLTVARHLPVTYRSHATSFIAMWSLGIHHTLLNLPLGNLKTTDVTLSPLTARRLYFVLLHIMNVTVAFLLTFLLLLASTSTETLGLLPTCVVSNLELRGGNDWCCEPRSALPVFFKVSGLNSFLVWGQFFYKKARFSAGFSDNTQKRVIYTASSF